MDTERENLIRRLKYLARRRSTLELDLVLGRIAHRLDWDKFSEKDLSALTAILELDDLTLQKALMSRDSAPDGVDPGVWARLLALIE